MTVRSRRAALGAGAMALLLLAACGKKTEYPPEVQRATYGSCLEGFKAKAPTPSPPATWTPRPRAIASA